jgi:hypothetical protein
MPDFLNSDAFTGAPNRYDAPRVPLAIGAAVIQEVNHNGTDPQPAAKFTESEAGDAINQLAAKRADFYKNGGK